MMFVDELRRDQLQARREVLQGQDSERVRSGVLTVILADAQARAKSEGHELGEDDAARALKAMHKKMTQVLELAPTEQVRQELAIMESYLDRHELRPAVFDQARVPGMLDTLIADNPDKFDTCRSKPQNTGWFVGQLMKATGGAANPAVVKQLLEERLAV